MNFAKALELMKQGHKVKLPSWGGFWYWDPVKDTVMMRTKDDELLDIRETQVVAYTLLNVASDEWIIADKENTPILGGTATFNFGEAIKYLKRGYRVTRMGWNGKEMWVMLCNPEGCYTLESDGKAYGRLPYLYMKTADNNLVPWLASQTDMLADDWIFYNS